MEAFGRVTFEYLALGRPVIGAASGGTLEMINDGQNGFLFKPGSAEQLADKIRFYVKNPGTLQEHKENARSSADKMMKGKNSADNCIEKITALPTGKEYNGYKLPNYVQSWLDIPATARSPRKGLLIIPRVKRAIELGPKGTVQRVQFKINQKFK
jgi:hypothetical protein